MVTMEERPRERRRRRHTHRLRKFVLLLVVLLAFAGAYHYVHRPGFAFGSVQIHGTNLFTQEQILRMCDAEPPVNLFRLSKSRILKALRGDVRVAKAEAYYNVGFPPVLNIYVNERVPVLYVQTGYGDYAKLDASGLVLDITDGIKDASVPRLTGVRLANIFIGDTIETDDVKEVMKFLLKLAPEARQQVAELTIDGNHKLVLRMDYGFPVMLGPVNELAGKADLFMTVYNEMKGKNIQALYMDLEYSKPYVRLKSDAIEQQKIAAQQKQQQEQRAQQEKRRQQAVQKQKQEQQTKKQ